MRSVDVPSRHRHGVGVRPRGICQQTGRVADAKLDSIDLQIGADDVARCAGTLVNNRRVGPAELIHKA